LVTDNREIGSITGEKIKMERDSQHAKAAGNSIQIQLERRALREDQEPTVLPPRDWGRSRLRRVIGTRQWETDAYVEENGQELVAADVTVEASVQSLVLTVVRNADGGSSSSSRSKYVWDSTDDDNGGGDCYYSVPTSEMRLAEVALLALIWPMTLTAPMLQAKPDAASKCIMIISDNFFWNSKTFELEREQMQELGQNGTCTRIDRQKWRLPHSLGISWNGPGVQGLHYQDPILRPLLATTPPGTAAPRNNAIYIGADNEDVSMPSYNLDMVKSADEGPMPTRIYNTESQQVEELSRHEEGQYAILSYVWDQHQDDDALKRLVTRLMRAVGLNKIWIDRWCIRQQDARDVATEILKMGQYYSRASCTIALVPEITGDMRGIARNVGDLMWLASCRKQEAETIAQYGNSRWLSRVWTLQEALLSTNTILVGARATCPLEAVEALARVSDAQCEAYCLGMLLGRQRMIEGTAAEAASHGGIVKRAFLLEPRGKGASYESVANALSFSEAMTLAAGRIATKEEDEVYGLLGLVRGTEAVKLEYGIGRVGALKIIMQERIVGAEIMMLGSVESGSHKRGTWEPPQEIPLGQLAGNLSQRMEYMACELAGDGTLLIDACRVRIVGRESYPGDFAKSQRMQVLRVQQKEREWKMVIRHAERIVTDEVLVVRAEDEDEDELLVIGGEGMAGNKWFKRGCAGGAEYTREFYRIGRSAESQRYRIRSAEVS
jgi:hypothetical protein